MFCTVAYFTVSMSGGDFRPNAERCVAHYRCYFIGRDGKIAGAEIVEAETARDAIDISRKLAAQSDHAFELWQGQARLHKEAPAKPCAAGVILA
jgi:hypothetical protein